jgi:hypothetical protein
VFQRLLGLRNDLGLLSEEYDTHTRRLIGNFPQALTHLALVNTALDLHSNQGPTHRRAPPRAAAVNGPSSPRPGIVRLFSVWGGRVVFTRDVALW